jgi:hypothetical protein
VASSDQVASSSGGSEDIEAAEPLRRRVTDAPASWARRAHGRRSGRFFRAEPGAEVVGVRAIGEGLAAYRRCDLSSGS